MVIYPFEKNGVIFSDDSPCVAYEAEEWPGGYPGHNIRFYINNKIRQPISRKKYHYTTTPCIVDDATIGLVEYGFKEKTASAFLYNLKTNALKKIFKTEFDSFDEVEQLRFIEGPTFSLINKGQIIYPFEMKVNLEEEEWICYIDGEYIITELDNNTEESLNEIRIIKNTEIISGYIGNISYMPGGEYWMMGTDAASCRLPEDFPFSVRYFKENFYPIDIPENKNVFYDWADLDGADDTDTMLMIHYPDGGIIPIHNVLHEASFADSMGVIVCQNNKKIFCLYNYESRELNEVMKVPDDAYILNAGEPVVCEETDEFIHIIYPFDLTFEKVGDFEAVEYIEDNAIYTETTGDNFEEFIMKRGIIKKGASIRCDAPVICPENILLRLKIGR